MVVGEGGDASCDDKCCVVCVEVVVGVRGAATAGVVDSNCKCGGGTAVGFVVD